MLGRNQALRREIGLLHEEWAIHDYDGFEGTYISEYADIANVSEMACFIAEHGKLGSELITHYGGLESAERAIQDHYAGEFTSVADFAQQLTEDTTESPESLQHYIDYAAMARDLEINDLVTIELGFEEVHVFWNH